MVPFLTVPLLGIPKWMIPAAAGAMLLGAVLCRAAQVVPEVHPQPIIVRLVDGKDGTVQPRRHLVLTGGYDDRDLNQGLWQQEALTDNEGTVRLSNQLRNLPLLRVEVLKGHGCEPGASRTAYGVEHIRASGQSGANRCGTVVATEAPGLVTIFVKGKKTVANLTATVAPPESVVPRPQPETAPPHPQPVTTVKLAPERASEKEDAAAATPQTESAHPAASAPVRPTAKAPFFLAFPAEDSLAESPDGLADSPPSPPPAPPPTTRAATRHTRRARFQAPSAADAPPAEPGKSPKAAGAKPAAAKLPATRPAGTKPPAAHPEAAKQPAVTPAPASAPVPAKPVAEGPSPARSDGQPREAKPTPAARQQPKPVTASPARSTTERRTGKALRRAARASTLRASRQHLKLQEDQTTSAPLRADPARAISLGALPLAENRSPAQTHPAEPDRLPMPHDSLQSSPLAPAPEQDFNPLCLPNVY